MTSPVQLERQLLLDAQAKGPKALLGAYLRLSGPGWLQSAITLGGGSLAGALFLGVIGGYEFLWVQLVAMIMGVTMLCAISYIALSTGKSPFQTLKNEINPVLAWGWLIASLMANLVWVLPQYSLAYAALSQNLFPEQLSGGGAFSQYLVSIIIFMVVTAITLCYGKQGLGIKIYETVLKLVVAAIVLSFMGVVFKLATSADDFDIVSVLAGFIPNPMTWFRPAEVYRDLIVLLSPEQQSYWTELIVREQRTCLIGAASAAVGINMTFLLPYSMLNKGWGKAHRGLAIFDLSTGMVIPFVLAVSCVVIASAHMFHGKPYEGLLTVDQGKVTIHEDQQGYSSLKKTLLKREANEELGTVKDQEILLAAMLIKRDTGAFANALSTLTQDKNISNKLFGIGVLAMSLSTISMLMLISGFVFSEMLSVPHGGLAHKIGILCGATGIFWPVFWSGGSKAFLAIITSTLGYILLPIAFLAFFLMMNSAKILGEDLPTGAKRWCWNILMSIALGVTGAAATYTATTKTMGDVPVGTISLTLFVLAVIVGQIWMMRKHKAEKLSVS
jgi:hypothetical protein